MDNTACEETAERERTWKGEGRINPSNNQKTSMVGLENVFLVACNLDSDAHVARFKFNSTLQTNKVLEV